MEIGVWALTAVSEIARWMIGKLLMVFVRWWLDWIRRRVADAIVASDFKVIVVTGVDPLRLKLRFKLRNGSASGVRLNRLVVHLSCGGAPVASLVGAIAEYPSIEVDSSYLKLDRGKGASISIDFTPDIYLWSWLLLQGGYSLHSSSIELSTTWGNISVPLDGDLTSEVSGFKSSVDDFLRHVRARLVGP